MNTVNRPARLEQSDLDQAVTQALQRVAQATELSMAECGQVAAAGPGPGQLAGYQQA